MGYDELDIAGGGQAMAAFEGLLQVTDQAEREKDQEGLLALLRNGYIGHGEDCEKLLRYKTDIKCKRFYWPSSFYCWYLLSFSVGFQKQEQQHGAAGLTAADQGYYNNLGKIEQNLKRGFSHQQGRKCCNSKKR